MSILAKTIWAEARGEGEIGMTAIACVVLNRAAKPCWWGKDIDSVCLKKWQFSCWNKGDPNLEKLQSVDESDTQYSLASKIAQKAYNDELEDITDGATHYFDSRMPIHPAWSIGRLPCYVFGHHMFYKGIE